jgi:DNA-binding NtrC family response regulator
VRELRNAVRRLVVLAADLEGSEIKSTLIRCDGDLETTAMRLQVCLQGLKRRMTDLGLP